MPRQRYEYETLAEGLGSETLDDSLRHNTTIVKTHLQKCNDCPNDVSRISQSVKPVPRDMKTKHLQVKFIGWYGNADGAVAQVETNRRIENIQNQAWEVI